MDQNQILPEPPNLAGYPIGTPLPGLSSDHLPLKTNAAMAMAAMPPSFIRDAKLAAPYGKTPPQWDAATPTAASEANPLDDTNFTLEKLDKVMQDLPRPTPTMKILLSDYAEDLVQYRFPRSKKRRIRNKWAQRIENYRPTPWSGFKMMGDALVGHTKTEPMLVAIMDAIPKVSPLMNAMVAGVFGGMGLPAILMESIHRSSSASEHHLSEEMIKQMTPKKFKQPHLPI